MNDFDHLRAIRAMNDFVERFRKQKDLLTWVRQELDRTDSNPAFTYFTHLGNRNSCLVSENDRSVSLTADELNRRLHLAFSDRGVYIGDLYCNAIDHAIASLLRFLSHRDNTCAMQENVPGYTPTENAYVHEEGAAAEVRIAWLGVLNFFEQVYPHGIRIVTSLRNTEPYANMFPTKSWDCICFSRCTGYPFTMDGPVIRPLTEDRAQICDFHGNALFEGSNAEVMEALMRFTPPDWNHASQGDSETYLNYK